MPAPLPPWSDTVFRVAMGAGVGAVLGVPLLLMAFVRTPAYLDMHEPKSQPVMFDPRHHVRDDGIDCMYCHYDAERSPSAGVPGAGLCMSCHAQIWNDSSMLEPVRRSAYTGEPIEWERVHNLPDFVYFNHAAHVNNGVGCESCHGRVDFMARIQRAKPIDFASRMNVFARDNEDAVAARTPLGRIGRDEDMAAAAIYLASRAGDFVVGETLTVDGGIVHANLPPDWA